MVAWSSIILAAIAAAVASASPVYDRAPGAITNCYDEGAVALTFDDGPSENLDDLVGILNDAGVKGTFFFNGQNYGNIYDRQAQVKRAYNSGHQIASHTWRHAHLTTLHGATLEAEFKKTNDAIRAIIGKKPAFVRPPYGEYNDEVLNVAEKYGQRVVNWSFDSGDSAGVSVQESKDRYDAAASGDPAPLLALNHETHPDTVYQVIPYAIDTLRKGGYTDFVTVAECLNMPPYN